MSYCLLGWGTLFEHCRDRLGHSVGADAKKFGYVTVGAFWEIREYGRDVPETATGRYAPNEVASPMKGTVRPTRI